MAIDLREKHNRPTTHLLNKPYGSVKSVIFLNGIAA